MKKKPELPFDKPIKPNPDAPVAKGPVDLKQVRRQLKRTQVKTTFWGS